MTVTAVTSTAMFDDLMTGTALVEFGATWCGPCRMQAPVLAAIADKQPDMAVATVDVDQQPELASRFAIRSVPTLLVVVKGEVVERLTGFHPEAALTAILAKQTK